MMASAPAKVILSGEHSVVYGMPALAMAVSPRLRVSLSKGAPFLSFRALGISAPLSSEGSLFSFFARGFDVAGIEPCHVKVDSDFPIGSGLGSSAAMACSFIKAALPDSIPVQVASLATEMERSVHGNPSGVDPAVCSFGGLIEFTRGNISPLGFRELPIIIGCTGIRGNTIETVSHVRSLVDADPSMMDLIKKIGSLVLSAKVALLNNDLPSLGSLMTENHSLLQKLGVSCPELDSLVDAALSAGALGAKLTGGGGGGCMIALSGSDDVGIAIEEAGGQVLKADAEREGVRLER